MSPLHADIAAFDARKAELERDHLGEWVVFYKGDFIGAFANFEEAAELAVERYDQGPYLIRQVGAGPIHLGGGMVFRHAHANSPSRV